jgi:hypothetical protein
MNGIENGEERSLPGRSEHGTLTLRSRQTLQERDCRLGDFLDRESGAGRISPAMGDVAVDDGGEVITLGQRRCGI